MAYKVYFDCDKCGVGYSWTNYSVTMPRATAIARKEGWQVGKRGWLCPSCKKKKEGKK